MAAHRHLRHGERAERRGLDAAGLHASGPHSRPGRRSSTSANGGTEYFLSSNAADEAQHPVAGTGGSRTSNQLIVWTLTNTASLNTATPSAQPEQQDPDRRPVWRPAEAAAARFGHAADDGRAAGPLHQRHDDADHRRRLVAGGCCSAAEPAHNEVVSRPDSNDTRMQQVMYANGKLWGALDTALNPDGGAAAGRHRVVHRQPGRGQGRPRRAISGRAGHDFTYPAIGVTAERSRRDGVHRHG